MDGEKIRYTAQDKRRFAACYATFTMNGALALTVGTLMPYVRDAYGLDYTFAGLLVSLHSLGNLMASFGAGLLPLAVGRRKSVVLFSACYSLSFLLMLAAPWRWTLALAFWMTGLARGAASNFNNTAINETAPGQAWALNTLHASFGVGAFLAPLMVMLCAQRLGSWRLACGVMIALGAAELALYATVPIPNDRVTRSGAGGAANLGFLRERSWWMSTATLFFYLCTEQGVIGWMVTYFQDTGIMSAAYAQVMASVLWLLILAGRLTAAWVSRFVEKDRLMVVMGVGMTAFFAVVMTARTLPLITAGIAGFGFSMAGIYPTAVAQSSDVIGRYPLAWSVMLTAASCGSILMPSVIGAVAERAGIAVGMSTIVVTVCVMLGVILANRAINRSGAKNGNPGK